MTDPRMHESGERLGDEWDTRHLAACVSWIRARLESLATSVEDVREESNRPSVPVRPESIRDEPEHPKPLRVRRVIRRRGLCGWLFGNAVIESETVSAVVQPDRIVAAEKVLPRLDADPKEHSATSVVEPPRIPASTVSPTTPAADLPPQAASPADVELAARTAPLPPHIASLPDNQLRSLAEAALQAGHQVPLVELSERLGLDGFEQIMVMLCAAFELDTRVGALCGQACGDPHRPYPTFAVGMRLAETPSWSALTPDRPLRRAHLLDVQQPAGTQLVHAALRLDEAVLHYLKGWRRLDERLAGKLTPILPGDAERLTESQASHENRIIEAWRLAAEELRPWPLAQLTGSNSENKQLLADVIARRCSFSLLRISAAHLPTTVSETDEFIRLWRRDSRLYQLALYVDADESLGSGVDPTECLRSAGFQQLLGEPGPLFVATRDLTPPLVRERVHIDVGQPSASEQWDEWFAHLGPGRESLCGRLATQFSLSTQAIFQIHKEASLLPDAAFDEERLWNACRQRTRPRVEGLARLIDSKATWDDLVLPQAQMEQLRQLAAQVECRWQVYDVWKLRTKLNRGLGVGALFSGESGTGKTMTAEVIANDLGLDLFRIDLSAVVSKYIGETEKNLRRLFDAFEDCGAVLFFDECDALFGKRTEVKDSHDRYANIEVSYLLQRLESYRGLAILATNHRSAIDTAFLRRLRFVINFPSPDVTLRKELWAKLLPKVGDLPTADLDYGWLAKFELTGGNIQTAATNAAFLAAHREHRAVTMADVCDAIRGELSKLNRSTSRGDFELPRNAADHNRLHMNGRR